MFDCHAHLTDACLREGLNKYLEEAEEAGVGGIVVVSECLDDAQQVTWNAFRCQPVLNLVSEENPLPPLFRLRFTRRDVVWAGRN